MDQLITKYNGDIEEYRRIKRYLFRCNSEYNIDIKDILLYGYDTEKVFDYDWNKANTPMKRKKLLQEVSELPSNYHESERMKRYPECYALALYEDEVQDILNDAVILIQKYVKGMLVRKNNGIYNPNCFIGKQFLENMFKYWKSKES